MPDSPSLLLRVIAVVLIGLISLTALRSTRDLQVPPTIQAGSITVESHPMYLGQFPQTAHVVETSTFYEQKAQITVQFNVNRVVSDGLGDASIIGQINVFVPFDILYDLRDGSNGKSILDIPGSYYHSYINPTEGSQIIDVGLSSDTGDQWEHRIRINQLVFDGIVIGQNSMDNVYAREYSSPATLSAHSAALAFPNDAYWAKIHAFATLIYPLQSHNIGSPRNPSGDTAESVDLRLTSSMRNTDLLFTEHSSLINDAYSGSFILTRDWLQTISAYLVLLVPLAFWIMLRHYMAHVDNPTDFFQGVAINVLLLVAGAVPLRQLLVPVDLQGSTTRIDELLAVCGGLLVATIFFRYAQLMDRWSAYDRQSNDTVPPAEAPRENE